MCIIYNESGRRETETAARDPRRSREDNRIRNRITCTETEGQTETNTAGENIHGDILPVFFYSQGQGSRIATPPHPLPPVRGSLVPAS